MSAGWLINSFRSTYSHIAGCNVYSCLFVQSRNYAARKGTREKARKKKVKAAVQKVGFVPANKFKKDAEKEIKRVSPFIMLHDFWRRKHVDNVWLIKYHRRPVFSLQEAIEFHRETHHPTVFNLPNAHINALIELNLHYDKKKYLDKISRIVEVPHPFALQEDRTILAFCKTANAHDAAVKAGANFVGGVELIKQIQKFPNVKGGTLSNNIGQLVKKFKDGIGYSLVQDNTYKAYGIIDFPFGTLNMDLRHLQENFSAVINDVQSVKPKSDASFIQRVRITSLPSREKFKIDFEQYLPKEAQKAIEDDEEEQDSKSGVIALQ
ncbi:PREDICTED: uncharacterized protein LOC107195035 [Dufourea novaeangliae]|uniref:uncharacterized protein LOC107195035 n=1 Tax=Dufourea novaeangliae TaxID=178035 RepID=UPI000767BA0A|nr:PREDICTED: uncharacterized protein LOC107195035 [Dufourea novaeangliae]